MRDLAGRDSGVAGQFYKMVGEPQRKNDKAEDRTIFSTVLPSGNLARNPPSRTPFRKAFPVVPEFGLSKARGFAGPREMDPTLHVVLTWVFSTPVEIRPAGRLELLRSTEVKSERRDFLGWVEFVRPEFKQRNLFDWFRLARKESEQQ